MTEKNLTQRVYAAVRREAERLLPRLDDPQADVREATAEELGRIGSFEAVPALIRLLNDNEGRVRCAAVEALGEIGSADAVPHLIKILQDRYAGSREAAAQALGNIASYHAVEALVHLLKGDESSHVKLAAIEALGEIGSTEALPALKECAKSRDDVGRCASAAIESIRSAAADLLDSDPEAEPKLDLDAHPSLAHFAAGVHGAWKLSEIEHVRGCDSCQRLVAVEWSIRHPEIDTLAEYVAEPTSFPYAVALRRHLDHDGCHRCSLLSRSGLVIGVAELMRLGRKLSLKCISLNALMPAPAQLAPVQEAVFAHESVGNSSLVLHETEDHALRILADISLAEAASGRVRLEIMGERGHRSHDLEPGKDATLGLIGDVAKQFGQSVALISVSASRESLEQLASWLFDPSKEARLAAAKVIGALGGAASTPEILDKLVQCLRDTDADVRRESASALSEMGAVASRLDILDALAKLAQDPDERVRRTAEDVKSAIALSTPEPQWLMRAQALLETFTTSAAKITAKATDAIQQAAALVVLLGAQPQLAGVRGSPTAVHAQAGADPLLACEKALRNAELSGRPEPTVTLAAPGCVLRLIKLRGGQWALRAKSAGATDWQPFALVAFADAQEIACLRSDGLTLRLDQLEVLAGKYVSRFAVRFDTEPEPQS